MKSNVSLAERLLKKSPYEACRLTNVSRPMLWIRCNSANRAADAAVGFGYLNTMLSDGNGFGISLHFGEFMAVTIHGHNLQELFSKLLVHEVEWIQEFDPKLWDNPEEERARITGIEIQMRGHTDNKSDRPAH